MDDKKELRNTEIMYVSRQERALIEFIRKELEFGSLTVSIQNGEPARVETGIRSKKLE